MDYKMNDIKVLYLRTNQYCNAHCFMCDFWKNSKSEITEEQFEYVLNKSKTIEMIRFTGGEPLLCKKLPEYIKKCHSIGIKTSIITNGLLLNEKIDGLVKNGLDQIIISVDGSTSELHDRLRGTKGLWKKIDMIFERIEKEYPLLHTRVNTVVSEENISDIANMARWLNKHNVEQWSIIPIKLDNHKWSDKITLEDFKREYINFQKTIKNCKIQLMGYSENWADNIENFWKGTNHIRPKGNCHITHMVSFYDPFTNHFFPCNCIPHRKLSFCGKQEEKEWYFEHGHEYCEGCEPLNAYCADFPEKIEENIFNF